MGDGDGDRALAVDGFLRGGGNGENASSGLTACRVLGVLFE
jgi:hypothetical protein